MSPDWRAQIEVQRGRPDPGETTSPAKHRGVRRVEWLDGDLQVARVLTWTGSCQGTTTTAWASWPNALMACGRSHMRDSLHEDARGPRIGDGR